MIVHTNCTVTRRTMGVSSAAVADSIGADNRATSFGFLFALGYIGFSVSAGVSGFFSRVRPPSIQL
jgi:hypothetical protein